MSLFELYFKLGLQHIADLKGYDHILFILTLALATLNIMHIDTGLIEFLIPLTIFLTALANVISGKQQVTPLLHYLKYFAAFFFGLIHGLGFSNYLRSLLGSEKGLAVPLFSFNLGIEAGQLMIVALILLLTLVVVDLFRLPRLHLHLLLSGAGMGVLLVLLIERFPFG
ncbi:MAG: HupE/UreJ family protein [Bacteroidota bacterium]